MPAHDPIGTIKDSRFNVFEQLSLKAESQASRNALMVLGGSRQGGNGDSEDQFPAAFPAGVVIPRVLGKVLYT
ncbi:MAG: hypothetical protein ACI9TH_002287 [Kiritimatiellia bacterium]|jgi:hypothetical protein